jgi:protein SCO1/2
MKRLLLAIFFTLLASPCFALESAKEALEKAGVTTRLGETIDLNIPLLDSDGKNITVRGAIIPGRPIIITPVYYECPRLCGLFLTGLSKLLNELKLKLGEDFSILTVSFNPEEGPSLAQETRERYENTLIAPQSSGKPGWHFTVGTQEAINKLTGQLGFTFVKDGTEFAHAPVLLILTPEGKISQYFTSVVFAERDIRLALVEASQGRIGTPIDHFLLYCFRFDFLKGKYTWAAWNFMRIGVLLSALICVIVLFRYGRGTKNTALNNNNF